MRKLLLFFLTVSPFFLSAQHFELGANIGVSYYEGDLTVSTVGGRLDQVNFGGGGFLRYNINDYFAARASVNVGRISGEDGGERAERNLNFSSNILEFALTGEFNILGFQSYNLERVFSPFVFAGVAVFNYDPTTVFEGQTVDLQPLGTEGQGLDAFPDRQFYNLTQFAIPLGVGLKYALNDAWNVGLEGGIRITFTDYLDDVSKTYPGREILLESRGEIAADLSDRSLDGPRAAGRGRGNADVNDYYFFAGVTISYNFLDNGLVGSRGKRRNKTGCPTF